MGEEAEVQLIAEIMMWMIRSKTHKKPRYWSEEFGWTWKDHANTYTTAEKDHTLLPKGGVWEEAE